MTLKIKLLCNEFGEKPILPKRATVSSAGIDLAAFISAPIELEPFVPVVIPTGICVEIEESYAGFIYARSGLGTKFGITLSNGVGVIDSDYRGELKVGLCNISKNSYTINPNDRIAQLVISPVTLCDIKEKNELSITSRGENGFGSTGIC